MALDETSPKSNISDRFRHEPGIQVEPRDPSGTQRSKWNPEIQVEPRDSDCRIVVVGLTSGLVCFGKADLYIPSV